MELRPTSVTTGCALAETTELYLQGLPLGVDEPIDIATAIAAFSSKRLQEEQRMPAAEELGASENGFRWRNSDGGLRAPSADWRAVVVLGGQSRKTASVRDGGVKKKKPRAGHQPRVRGSGRGGGQPTEARQASKTASLLAHHLRRGAFVQSSCVSVISDGSRTSTGWSGKPPPKPTREEIQSLYREGRVGEWMGGFAPIPYPDGSLSPTFLLDRDGLRFLVRTSQFEWLALRREEFYGACHLLPGVEGKGLITPRGDHSACILGHARQYGKKPSLTAYHSSNFKACAAFIETPVVANLIKVVSSLVRLYFPGVAKRYEDCVSWQLKKYGVEPLFGLFFQFCLNGILPGQKRVHCRPHTDSKNVIGVCVLVVYELPGKSFDHRRRSWLVVWEAAVYIQLPPWVALLYPSALFLHFNIDISDLKLVTAPEGERPTKENSEAIGGVEGGRGSMVFFNQASLFQSSETNSETLKAAQRAGRSAKSDFPAQVQAAFEKSAVFVPISKLNKQ